MGACSRGSLIKVLILSSIIGFPWLMWLFFNWPTRRRIGVPVFFDYSQKIPEANATFLIPYGTYNLELEMTVPTSPVNQNIGQFMLNTKIFNNNKVFFESSRPALLTYTSQMSLMLRDVLCCLLDLVHFTSQTNTESFHLGSITFKYGEYVANLVINNNNIQIHESILWAHQRTVTWMWLLFYACMLGMYSLFLLLVGVFFIRIYCSSLLVSRGKTLSR